MAGAPESGVRTYLLLAVGLAGIIYETVAGKTDRPALLVVFLILCGFPLVVNLDKIMRGAITVSPPPEPPEPPKPPDPPSGGPAHSDQSTIDLLRRVFQPPPHLRLLAYA